MYGGYAYASRPIAALPAGVSAAVADPFADLLADPDAEFVYLLRATPYDETLVRSVPALPGPIAALPFGGGPRIQVTGGETAVYLSDGGFATGADDDPAHTRFTPRLMQPFNFGVRGVDPAAPAQPGGRRSIGDIAISNSDGVLDNLLALHWDGRVIEVLAGEADFPYADFAVIFRGTAAGIGFDQRTISIRLRDRQAAFDRPLGGTLYAGTGGLEGGAELAGRHRPVAFGSCFNVSPVAVDPLNLVYQVHDRAIQAIEAVRDKGSPLVFDFDTSDIYAAWPAAGKYSTDLSRGLIRLSLTGQPGGRLTADVRGDAAGGYVATAGAIARRIATSRLSGDSVIDPDEIDGAAFAALDTAFAATCGLYVTDGGISCAQAMDALLGSAGGWWTFTRQDMLTVGRLAEPTSPTVALTDREAGEFTLVLESLPLPAWRRRLKYRRNFTPQRRDELAGSLTEAQMADYVAEARTSVASSELFKSRHRLAEDAEDDTLIALQADADAESARRLAVHGATRRVYRVIVHRRLFRIWLGTVVSLESNRFGLSPARSFVVIGLAEDAGRRESTLWLWG